jgi:hypothetical protein
VSDCWRCSDPSPGLDQANRIGDVDTYMGYAVDPKGWIDTTDGDSESGFTAGGERVNWSNVLELEHAGNARFSQSVGLGADRKYSIEYKSTWWLLGLTLRKIRSLLSAGLHSFRVASDCANAVRSLLGEGFDSFGPIVREINVRRRNFTRADFVFKGRKSNVNAHILARSSVNLSTSRHVWFLEPPDEVCNSYPTE